MEDVGGDVGALSCGPAWGDVPGADGLEFGLGPLGYEVQVGSPSGDWRYAVQDAIAVCGGGGSALGEYPLAEQVGLGGCPMGLGLAAAGYA